MSVGDWYGEREIILTGVTSELGRALLEKLLRAFPNIRIYTILRSRYGLSKDDRIKNIIASPGYERLRQEAANAAARVKALEGNLLYENLGLSKEDSSSLSNVEIVFHAGGPRDEVLEFSKRLPRLRAIVTASTVFRHKGPITEKPEDGNLPDIPLAILRFPFLGPAYKEPIPGYVEILRGPTALMVGAGYALGDAESPAQVLPIDLAVNALIVAAWDKGLRDDSKGPVEYNAPSLGCTWGQLVEKGGLANRKFSYPTFGPRGMTSMRFLHWMVVLLLEWLPSVVCDTLLSVFGAKPRCVQEHEKVRKALRTLEPIASSSWPVERNRIYQLQERLTFEDRDTYPICSEIDVESYVLCAAASARKYCVNEVNLKIVKSFSRLFIALLIIFTFYYFFK